jgi:hypothetical protein
MYGQSDINRAMLVPDHEHPFKDDRIVMMFRGNWTVISYNKDSIGYPWMIWEDIDFFHCYKDISNYEPLIAEMDGERI